MKTQVEIVKMRDNVPYFDEVYTLCTCPSCEAEVARGWLHCPACGGELPYGELKPVKTCRNLGDESIFECSECHRKYVPVQIIKEQDKAEWNNCPGCGALVERLDDVEVD